MKKKVLIGLSIFILLFIAGVRYFFYYNIECMSCLPQGVQIEEVVSPDEMHSLRAYIVNEHATTPFSVRVEVLDMDTNKTKNIYWNFPQQDVHMKWKDNNIVIIDNKELNITSDIYDKRNVK
ncbi:DUF5412 family protein [Paenibacillus sp. FA6]|uniref:DUF5412 family protein n=1 Tax=Paenibacillus sp. FA6 TaxID=3413029 RepID=UPI003F65FC0E